MPSVSRDIIHRLTSQQWYPSLVRCLLERGADATYLDDNADSVLHRFLDSTDGHSDEVYLEITQLLVESDCPIDVPNWIGRTPLHFAAQRGITSVVSFLLERECKIPEDIIHHTRGPACFRLLIQYGANVRAVAKNGDTVLHSLFCRNWPGRANGLEILEALVEGGCDVNAKNEIADPVIFWAVSCDLSAAQYIIDSGAYIPKDILMRTMKYFAIWEDDPRQHGDNLPSYFDMLSFFTRQKLPPDIFAIIGFGRNPLHVLLRGAQPTFYSAKELLELVRSFVEGGCDCLVPDATGETPLYLAVKVRHGELVTYLTSKGAEFSDAKKLHRLPLDWAAQLPWYQSALTAAIALNGGNSCVPDNFYIEGYDRC
ncbi:hypothetical protein ID866_7014 [Astraeus odoratus]|nr:hypothetical protein ID866_7014 [Astraeus odoratus]